MKAKDFDKKFSEGENITDYLDLSKARHLEQEQRRIGVDLPIWMINALDKESKHLGIPRQLLIKMLIARHLEEAQA